MHIRLAETLFHEKLFVRDMEIVGKYSTATIGNINTIETSDTFVICSIGRNRLNEIVFSTLSTKDGHRRVFQSDAIVAIDGMTPARFAAVYGIAPDGSPKRQGTRRGRKPKIRESLIED